MLRVSNSRTGTVVGDRVVEARTFGSKLRGLMFRARLEPGEGMLLRDTPSIHMCFMRFPIDAVFLSNAGVVVAVRAGLRPWWGLAGADASDVLELPAGTAATADLQVGDRLAIEST